MTDLPESFWGRSPGFHPEGTVVLIIGRQRAA